MALPAVICYYIVGPFLKKGHKTAMAASFAGGFLSVFLSGVLLGASLIFTEKNFWEVSSLVVAAHFPVMLIEGIITSFCIAFLIKVRPEILP